MMPQMLRSSSSTLDPAYDAATRVCMLSLRGINGLNRQAAWCSNYEFEDVVCSVDDVDLLSPRSAWAYSQRIRLIKGLLSRGISSRLARVNPGIETLHLQRDYDLFVFICMTPQDLLYLNALKGWQERCRVKLCLMVELWNSWIPKYEHQLGLLKDFDHVNLCFGSSVPALERFLGQSCHHVPLGADVARFTPYPNPPQRCIDIYSMGRRIPATHEAMMRMAGTREIFYIYDTIPSDFIRPAHPPHHRDLVANLAKRSRFFVSYPALTGSDASQGQSEVGARFFEGAAAGAAMIGQAPSNPAFEKDFGWPDAVIPVGTTEDEVREATASFKRNPEKWFALSRKNAIEALRRFDWSHRWKEMLRIAGIPSKPRLQERESHFNRLADDAAAASPGTLSKQLEGVDF